jgi:hypothetical protein
MPHSQAGAPTAREAARKLAEARRLLDHSRQLLARAPRHRRASSYILTGRWKTAENALESNRERLRGAHGVVAHGLGFRVRDGIETDEVCVVVFVRKKITLRTLGRQGYTLVPPHLYHGKSRVATDVVRLGPLKPQAGLESIAPVAGGEFGTIGALAFDADTRERVAITAMHVSGLKEFGPTAFDQGIPFSLPSGTGREDGRLVFGTSTGIDAAKVILEDPDSVLAPLPVADVRPISHDGNIPVHLFGAVSGFINGVVKYLKVDDAEDRLIETLLVDIPTKHGDSGAGLVDNSNFLIGFLFGLAPTDLAAGLRVFCPADLVMSRLGCTMQ